MKYYLNSSTNSILALAEDGSQDHLITTGLVKLSVAEVANLHNPINRIHDIKVKQLESARNTAITANVVAHNRQWQADEVSQKLLSSAIILASAGGLLPNVWRDADNNNMVITHVNDLLLIAGAMAIQTQAAYTKSWVLKADVETAFAANNKAAIEAVAW